MEFVITVGEFVITAGEFVISIALFVITTFEFVINDNRAHRNTKSRYLFQVPALTLPCVILRTQSYRSHNGVSRSNQGN